MQETDDTKECPSEQEQGPDDCEFGGDQSMAVVYMLEHEV
jgi:hypothetical protein